ncbi:MAG: hypothetical protein Q4D90_07430 [bacterium]|nr:hypothetical protein [bacterium]
MKETETKKRVAQLLLGLAVVAALLSLGYVFFSERKEQQSREALYQEVKDNVSVYEEQKEELEKQRAALLEEEQKLSQEEEEQALAAASEEHGSVARVLFGFDSHDKDLYSSIYPKLSEYGWTGTVVLDVDERGFGELNEEELAQMCADGWTITYENLLPSFGEEVEETTSENETRTQRKQREWEAKLASLSNALEAEEVSEEAETSVMSESEQQIRMQSLGEDITVLEESLQETETWLLFSDYNLQEDGTPLLGEPVVYDADVYDSLLAVLKEREQAGRLQVGSFAQHESWQQEAVEAEEARQRQQEEEKEERRQKQQEVAESIQSLESEIESLQKQIEETWVKRAE